MASWNFVGLTDKAHEYLLRVKAGEGRISITRAISGASSSPSPSSLTSVLSPKQDMSIMSVHPKNDAIQIDLQMTNLDLTEPYKMHQIGVYANYINGSESEEFLYIIAQCDVSGADTIPIVTTNPLTLDYRIYLSSSNAPNVQVLIDPAGLVTLEEFSKLCDYVGYSPETSYGVEVDFENKTIERIGASQFFTPGDFDDVTPWGQRKRCNLTDDGVVLSYYGEPSYTETGFLEVSVTKKGITYPKGTPVQVMVEQPKFWYKLIPVKTESVYDDIDPSQVIGYSLCRAQYLISPEPKQGFEVFPLFIKGDNKEVDFVYLSAFSGSIQDWSEQTLGSSDSSYNSVCVVNADEGYSTTLNDFEFEIYADGFLIGTVPVAEGISIADAANILIESLSEGSELCNKLSEAGYTMMFPYYDSEYRRAVFQSIHYKDGFKYGVEIHAPTFAPFTVEYRDVVQTRGSGYVKHNEYSPEFIEKQGIIEKKGLLEYFNVNSLSKVPLALSSVANVSPAEGFSLESLNYFSKRHLKNPSLNSSDTPGLQWKLTDYTAICCDIWLILIEYASFSVEKVIGKGIDDLYIGYTDNHLYCRVYENGFTEGSVSGAFPFAVDRKGVTQCIINYRGEENLWGGVEYIANGCEIKYSGKDVDVECTLDPCDSGSSVKISPPPLPVNPGYYDRLAFLSESPWAFFFNRCEGSSEGELFGAGGSSGGNTQSYFLSYATVREMREMVKEEGLTDFSYVFKSSSSEYEIIGGFTLLEDSTSYSSRLMYVPND